MQNSVANVQQTVTIFYPDAEPLLKYSPVTLHLSPLLVLMKTLILLFQFNPYFIFHCLKLVNQKVVIPKPKENNIPRYQNEDKKSKILHSVTYNNITLIKNNGNKETR